MQTDVQKEPKREMDSKIGEMITKSLAEDLKLLYVSSVYVM